jgi:hydroxymethylbilane synthase
VELVPVVAGADRDLQTPLYGMGGVGVFAAEVHQAVLAGAADAGVHSCKDLPTTAPEGMVTVAYGKRADPRDALVGSTSLDALPEGAVVGSSSLRRRAQLAALRPDLRFVDLRGNVATRLRKISEGQADATLLAMAGLGRLGLLRQVRATALHPSRECTPAAAQGLVAIDCRVDDRLSRRLIQPLDHGATRQAAAIERNVLAGLRGGCTLPLGVWARRIHNSWQLDAALERSGRLRRVALSGPSAQLAERCLRALNED